MNTTPVCIDGRPRLCFILFRCVLHSFKNKFDIKHLRFTKHQTTVISIIF